MVDLRRGRRRRMSYQSDAGGRLPPHSVESEQGLLGCMLLSPNDCIGMFLEKCGEEREVCYDLRHQAILELMVEMYDRKEAIDLITLHQRLKDKNQIESVGGFAYLASLPDATPSAANFCEYLGIVREKATLRALIQTCTGAVAKVYECESTPEALLDEVGRDILRVTEQRAESNILPPKERVQRAITLIEKLHANKGALTGLGTGFPDFDKMTTGLHGGEMIIIAARPSQGKSSLAMNIADAVAVEQQAPVCVFSLEMTADSLMLRAICSRARVNLRNVGEGFLVERDFPKLTASAAKLSNAPLYIDDTPSMSIMQLRAKARRLWQQYGIKLFIIDYLQLLHSTSRKAENNRQNEITEISGGIKALAKELGVPIIALSQLNRDLEKDKHRKPRLSDLRESGSLEADADLVGLLYKPNSVDDNDAQDEHQEGIAVNLLIAKQRSGPTGDVALTFIKSYTKFESAAKISDLDLPSEV